jgi:hypothetical protein
VGTKRVLGRVVVVSAAVIAACFGSEPYLSSTSQAVMQASPGTVLFGSVLVGTDSAGVTVTLNNSMVGEANTITSIAPTSGTCPEFIPTFNIDPTGYVVSNCEGAEGSGVSTGTDGTCVPAMYQFSMVFHPTAPGPAGCEYTIAYAKNGSGGNASFTIQFSGAGMAPANSLKITPTVPINFGDVQTNSDSAPAPVTLLNNGTNVQTVTGASSDSNNFITTPSVAGTFSLPSMMSRNYTVKCRPVTTGPKAGTLSFTSQAPAVSVGVTCNGIMPTGLTILPANFPSTLVGKPVDADISIENTTPGQVMLQIGFTSNAGTEVTLTQNPSGPVDPGSTVHAIVHFSAATERQLGALANLSIGFASGPAAQAVVINGEALKASLGTAPGSTIDFGPVCVGASPTMDVQLYASGLGAIQLTSVTPPAPPFTASATPGVMMGNHGNMIRLTAGVAPVVAGELSDKVVLLTDIPLSPNQELKLLATALPAGVSPTPAQVHFGPAHTMMTTPYKEIIVSNCGTTPITLTSTRIEGVNGAEFAVVSQLPTQPLDQKSQAKIAVVMTPQGNGAKSAQLIVEYSGGVIAVDLDGNGFGGEEASKGDRSTYYTCNAGGGSTAGASIALLALFLRRRRRAHA